MQGYLKEILENAGWYFKRRIDISYMIEELREAGFETTNLHIHNFLKEFGNLNIEYKTPNEEFSNIKINIEALYQIDKRDVDKISIHLQDKLIPVGSIHEDSALLFTSNLGMFYMATEGKVYKIGSNFFDALSTIINQKNVLRIM